MKETANGVEKNPRQYFRSIKQRGFTQVQTDQILGIGQPEDFTPASFGTVSAWGGNAGC